MGDRATRMTSVTLIKGPTARSMRWTLRRHGKSATQPIRLAPSPILGPEAQKNIITIVGRGHSGTRAISHTLRESGVYTGEPQNESSDLLPPDDMYEAVKVMNRHVKYLGNLRWDFTKLHTMPIDPVFIKLIESYLSTVLNSKAEWRGWKIPETTLVFPWIVRLFPEIRYIFWIRDPRDAILGAHLTDDLADWGLEYDETDDMRLRRAISWKYQQELVKATPKPEHWHEVRFEDFVLWQDETLAGLEKYLGFELAKIPVKPEAVGRWREDDGIHHFDFFTPDLLEYEYAKPSPLVYQHSEPIATHHSPEFMMRGAEMACSPGTQLFRGISRGIRTPRVDVNPMITQCFSPLGAAKESALIIGPDLGGNTLRYSLVPASDQFSGLFFKVGTHCTGPQGNVSLCIRSHATGAIVHAVSFDLRSIVDNGWFKIAFEPIVHSQGQRFVVTVSAKLELGRFALYEVAAREQSPARHLAARVNQRARRLFNITVPRVRPAFIPCYARVSRLRDL
jgi:sulfotransferase family protein